MNKAVYAYCMYVLSINTMRCLALRSGKTRLEPETTRFRGLGTQAEKTRPKSSTKVVFFRPRATPRREQHTFELFEHEHDITWYILSKEDVLGRLPRKASGPHGPSCRSSRIPPWAGLQQVGGPGSLGKSLDKVWDGERWWDVGFGIWTTCHQGLKAQPASELQDADMQMGRLIPWEREGHINTPTPHIYIYLHSRTNSYAIYVQRVETMQSYIHCSGNFLMGRFAKMKPCKVFIFKLTQLA